MDIQDAGPGDMDKSMGASAGSIHEVVLKRKTSLLSQDEWDTFFTETHNVDEQTLEECMFEGAPIEHLLPLLEGTKRRMAWKLLGYDVFTMEPLNYLMARSNPEEAAALWNEASQIPYLQPSTETASAALTKLKALQEQTEREGFSTAIICSLMVSEELSSLIKLALFRRFLSKVFSDKPDQHLKAVLSHAVLAYDRSIPFAIIDGMSKALLKASYYCPELFNHRLSALFLIHAGHWQRIREEFRWMVSTFTIDAVRLKDLTLEYCSIALDQLSCEEALKEFVEMTSVWHRKEMNSEERKIVCNHLGIWLLKRLIVGGYDYDSILNILEKTAALSPESYLGIIDACLMKKRTDDALRLYKRALHLFSECDETLLNKGQEIMLALNGAEGLLESQKLRARCQFGPFVKDCFRDRTNYEGNVTDSSIQYGPHSLLSIDHLVERLLMEKSAGNPLKRALQMDIDSQQAHDIGKKGRTNEDLVLDPERTLFVGNMPFESSEAQLVQFFNQHLAPCEYVTLCRDKHGRSRGLAHIVLRDPSDLHFCLSKDRILFQGRPLYINPYQPVPKTDRQRVEYPRERDPRILFVSHLPEGTTEDQLNQLFADFEGIESIRLVIDKEGHFKGIAYVQFGEEHQAAAALSLDQHRLEGHRIRVQVSDPQAARNRADALKMMPRSVKTNPKAKININPQ